MNSYISLSNICHNMCDNEKQNKSSFKVNIIYGKYKLYFILSCLLADSQEDIIMPCTKMKKSTKNTPMNFAISLINLSRLLQPQNMLALRLDNLKIEPGQVKVDLVVYFILKKDPFSCRNVLQIFQNLIQDVKNLCFYVHFFGFTKKNPVVALPRHLHSPLSFTVRLDYLKAGELSMLLCGLQSGEVPGNIPIRPCVLCQTEGCMDGSSVGSALKLFLGGPTAASFLSNYQNCMLYSHLATSRGGKFRSREGKVKI